MRVTKNMLDAACNALGHHVTEDRIRKAFKSLEKEDLTLSKAKLLLAQRKLECGELSEQIEDLSIYVACISLDGELRQHTLIVHVTAPPHIMRSRVKNLVQTFIDKGSDPEYNVQCLVE